MLFTYLAATGTAKNRFHSKLLATAGETLAGKAGGNDAPGQKSLSLASSKNQLAMGGSADTLQPVVEQLRDLIVTFVFPPSSDTTLNCK